MFTPMIFRHIAVTDGNEGSANTRTHEILGRKVGQQKERQNEIIAAKFIVEGQAQQGRRVDID